MRPLILFLIAGAGYFAYKATRPTLRATLYPESINKAGAALPWPEIYSSIYSSPQNYSSGYPVKKPPRR